MRTKENIAKLVRKPWASQVHDNQNHDTEKTHWVRGVGSACKEERSLSNIVEFAFRWGNTPQGYDYWMEIGIGLN